MRIPDFSDLWPWRSLWDAALAICSALFLFGFALAFAGWFGSFLVMIVRTIANV